jgi:DNA-binding NtrC family response regulator
VTRSSGIRGGSPRGGALNALKSSLAIHKLLERAAQGAPPRQLLAEVLDALLRELDGERAFLFRWRKTGGFQVVAARSRDREDVDEPLSRISHHAVRKMAALGAGFHVRDARRDRRFRTEESLRGKTPARSILVLPLRREGAVQGGVYLDHRFGELHAPGESADAVGALVALAGIVLELRDHAARGAAGQAPAAEAAGDDEELRPVRARQAAASEVELADFHGFLSANPDLHDLFDQVRGLSRSALPVLICGETGTGKGLLARIVHETSLRAAAPFVTLHCGTVPEGLIESELLGHVRGAFTGAEADQEGLFIRADGGTLFLDEVGDMSDDLQKKLLRVLEDGMVRPLGAKSSRQVDVRPVCATTRDLEEMVREGRFRRDLYFRLKGAVFTLVPLRDRPEDILALARRFLAAAASREGRPVPPLSEAAARALRGHSWPGNVRELENEMRRVVALGCTEVEPRHLTMRSRRRQGDPLGPERAGKGQALSRAVAAAEKAAILSALRAASGNKSRAASQLGITRKSLYRRMAKYGIRGA